MVNVETSRRIFTLWKVHFRYCWCLCIICIFLKIWVGKLSSSNDQQLKRQLKVCFYALHISPMELVMKTITMLLLIWKVFPSIWLQMKINQNPLLHPQHNSVNLLLYLHSISKLKSAKQLPTLGLVDTESIPFHSIVNQHKCKTHTSHTLLFNKLNQLQQLKL